MIKYSVKENKVIARFDEEWIYSISNYFAKIGCTDRKFILKYLKNKSNFFGIAKCHPDDNFNLNFGKDLSKNRLIENYKKTVKKLATIFSARYRAAENLRQEKLKNIYA